MNMQNVSVHLVTLKTRPDRRALFDAWAQRTDAPWSALLRDIQPFVAERHTRGGEYGCWDSHMQCMRSAIAQGSVAAVVFEDDATPTRAALHRGTWDTAMRQVESLIKSGVKWDLVALGGLPLAWSHLPTRVSRHLLQTPFAETHAYVASAAFMRRMVAMPFAGGIDYAMARRAWATSYVVVPELFEQNASGGSDVALSKVVSFRSAYKAVNALWAQRSPFRGRSVFMVAAVVLALATGASSARRSPIAVTLLLTTLLLACLGLYAANEILQDPLLPRRAKQDTPFQQSRERH
jgi:hypothetical protein